MGMIAGSEESPSVAPVSPAAGFEVVSMTNLLSRVLAQDQPDVENNPNSSLQLFLKRKPSD